MKTMTCKQLGGACDLEFKADTFEEMAKMSQTHGKEMMNDTAHMQAMQNMMSLMQDPSSMQKWMAEKKAEFDALPNV
ncbi:MAG: DUF1059 domain-containing protein [Bacteroidia bacterium]